MGKKLKRLALPALRRYTLLALALAFAAGLVAAFLWDKYVDRSGMALWYFALSTFGFVYVFAAWVCYLRLDGFNPFRGVKPMSKAERMAAAKPKSAPRGGGMLDSIDTGPQGGDLPKEDRLLCRMAAYIVCAVIMQIPSVVYTFI